MTPKVEFAPYFLKDLKRLKRKYSQVTDVVEELVKALENGEQPGDKIPNVGYDVYKVRLKNPSAGRGKSGGFRVIYYVQLADFVILVTIYSKSQQADFPAERLRKIIDEFQNDDDSED